MPEHWPGEKHKRIVWSADECCVCLRGWLLCVYPLRSCRVVTASEQPSLPGRSNMFPQSGCLSRRTSASVRDTGRKHLHGTDTQMKLLWLHWYYYKSYIDFWFKLKSNCKSWHHWHVATSTLFFWTVFRRLTVCLSNAKKANSRRDLSHQRHRERRGRSTARSPSSPPGPFFVHHLLQHLQLARQQREAGWDIELSFGQKEEDWRCIKEIRTGAGVNVCKRKKNEYLRL